jgi:signal transduction histidine kinase
MRSRIDRVVSADNFVVLFISGGIPGEHVDMLRSLLGKRKKEVNVESAKVCIRDSQRAGSQPAIRVLSAQRAPWGSEQHIRDHVKPLGVAVENVLLHEESCKQEEERVRKENVRLEERTRIAQELHDTLLQTFMSASLHLGAALYDVAPESPVKPRLERILQLMNQGVQEGRDAIQGLRPPESHTSDLVLALSRIRYELGEVLPDIDFRVIVAGPQNRLPSEIQYEIYRIGKEALVNALSHSGAERVELELDYSSSELHLRIRDNGRGIDPEVLEKGRDRHWGLAGMRERAAKIGGQLKILSSATGGTEVHLSIPLELSLSHHQSE